MSMNSSSVTWWLLRILRLRMVKSISKEKHLLYSTYNANAFIVVEMNCGILTTLYYTCSAQLSLVQSNVGNFDVNIHQAIHI